MSAQLPIRTINTDFSQVPRHWVAGSAAATCMINGLNMLFPEGERFFIRSVKHFLGIVSSAESRNLIAGFFGQEGQHAKAHDALNAMLKTQGYDIEPFLKNFAAGLAWVEARVSPAFNLAITAACEHYTAIFAASAFKYEVLKLCAPEMHEVLSWHAVEEMEHKSVAFDLLQEVAPSYVRRVLGLFAASAILGGYWFLGASTLLRQNRLSWLQALLAIAQLKPRPPMVSKVFIPGFLQYLRPNFHPQDNDDAAYAAAWLAGRNNAGC